MAGSHQQLVEAFMHGRIIIEKDTGIRWLFIPEAHIQLRTLDIRDLTKKKRFIITAFPTDKFQQTPSGPMPVEKWLEKTCQFTSHVEVPQHIVDFAAQSIRERVKSVEEFAELLQKSTETPDPEGGLRKYIESLRGSADTEEREHLLAMEINVLMASAGGLN